MQSHDHESSLNISRNEVNSSSKNSYEPRSWPIEETHGEPLDRYGGQVHCQCENGTCDESTSTGSFKSVKKRSYHGGNLVWIGSSLWLLFLQEILFVYASCISADTNKCALGINTPGRTWPHGDIIVEHGQPLRIYCMLNEHLTSPEFQGTNASDLVFFRNSMLVESKYITVVNETTIMLYQDRPSPSEDNYFCQLKLKNCHSQQYMGVCMNRVVVGFKPRAPQNFSCVSHNWENLVCTWDPIPNYITTKFSLMFRLPGRAGRRFMYPCPVRNAKRGLPSNSCRWDESTDPIYRQVYEYYTFILKAENVLGVESTTYKFNHFANVIPAKPINLSVVNITSSSALLQWAVPFPMQNFPPGLHHKVSYQKEGDSQETWQTITITNQRHTSEKYLNLTVLPHANAVYNVRVFLKSSKASGEDKWSKFSEINFKTAPTVPGLPPKTDIGSFEITGNNGNRDVYIYWKKVPARFENGDNFTYQVVSVEENGRKLDLQPHEITETYAKFEGIGLNNFVFEIVTANCVGPNNHKATVHVPSQLEVPQKPVVFTKIVFDGGIYELSWKSPSNSDITNYTIFWCENERDRPYQCSGYLDWVHVPRNLSVYNVTISDPKKIYQFAIAANTAQASSGMVWFSSTTTLSNVVGKVKSAWIDRVESDLIEVAWKLEYSGRIGIIEGFNIHYCPIVSSYNLTCEGLEMIMTMYTDSYMDHGLIRDLRPNTTYSIFVTVLTKIGQGLQSDSLYITTLKSAKDSRSKNPTFADVPPKPNLLRSNINELTAIERSSVIVDNFISNMNHHLDRAIDNLKLGRTDDLNSSTTNCMTQVNSLASTLSAFKDELDSLSTENRQLRESVLKCNEIL